MQITALQQLIPKGTVDSLKGGMKSLQISKLTSILLDIKSKMTNSSLKCLGLGQAFADKAELISDDILDKVLSVGGNYRISLSEVLTPSEALAFGEQFTTWFNAQEPVLDTDLYGQEIPTLVLTNSSGNIFKICQRYAINGYRYDNYYYDNGEPGIQKRFIEISSDGTSGVFDNALWDINGHQLSWWDLLHDQLENASLCSVIADCCTLVTNTTESDRNNLLSNIQDVGSKFSVIPTMANEWKQSKYPAVKQFANMVLKSFSQGGVYGVARSIIDFVLAANSTSVDSEGNLVFTSNTALIPQVYIAGVINVVVTVATTAAAFVVSIFSRVAGVVIALLGTVVTSIIRAVEYDYKTYTTAALVDGFDVPYPVAPYGLFATTYYIDIRNHAYDWCLANGRWFSYCPGGIMIYTISRESDTQGKVMIEFHPDLVDRRGCLMNHCSISGITLAVNLNALIDIKQTVDTFPSVELDCYNKLNSDSNTYTLSNSDSYLVLKVVCYNILIFLLTMQTRDSSTLNHTLYITYVGGTVRLSWNNTNWDEIPTGSLFDFWRTIYTMYNYSMVNNSPSSEWWTTVALLCDKLNQPYEFRVNDDVKTTYTGEFGTYSCIYRPTFSILNPNNSDPTDPTIYWANPIQTPPNMQYALLVPKYDRSTFIAAVVASITVTAVIAAVTIAATVLGKRSLNRKRAQLTAKAEKAWDTLKGDPSDENYMAYRKAVKKNNMFVKLFGGDSIDLNSYWASGGSSESAAEPGTFVNNLLSTDNSGTINDMPVDTEQVSVQTLIKLIKG